MRPIFISAIILFLLAACGADAPQVTATLPPTVTLTATPSFTEIPIATPTPTLTADHQAWKEIIPSNELSHFSLDQSGNVIDDRFPIGSEYGKAYVKTSEGLQLSHVFYGNWQTSEDGKYKLDVNGRPMPIELADEQMNQLDCVKKGKTCVYGERDSGHIGNAPVFMVEGVSTGAFEISPLYDPQTGEYLGSAYKSLVETMDQNKNRSSIPVIVQVVSTSGSNGLYRFLQTYNNISESYVALDSKMTATADQLSIIYDPGTPLRLLFFKETGPDEKWTTSNAIARKFYIETNLIKMSDYFESVNKGSTVAPDLEAVFIPTNWDTSSK